MPLGPEIPPVLDHLAGRIARGDLIVLVGAGASRWAGLPTWKEVACALARELAPALREVVPDAPLRFRPPSPEDPLSTEQLVRIGEAFRWICGEDRLVARLRELFDTARLRARDLPLHERLVRLSRFVPAFYTTNFDDLLERAFAAHGRPCQAVSVAEDLHDWRYDRVDGRFVARFPIYKLHGTLERPGSLVFGESDFQRRSDLASHPIDLRFASDVVGRELLLLGYSFSDPNVRWIWTKLRDLAVLPPAWFIELGESTDLDHAYFLKDRVRRVDLRASDGQRPPELLELLDGLLARCDARVTPPSRRRTGSSPPASPRSGSKRTRAASRPARTSGSRRRSPRS